MRIWKTRTLKLQGGHETSARTWCSGRTWRERVGREVGERIGMGKTCEPKAFSFQCMTEFTKNKKKKPKKNKKKTARWNINWYNKFKKLPDLLKLNISICYHLAFPLPDRCSPKSQMSTISKLEKLWQSHQLEYFTTMMSNDVQIHAKVWMNFTKLEKEARWKSINHRIPFT